jgi:hypothetical protein
MPTPELPTLEKTPAPAHETGGAGRNPINTGEPMPTQKTSQNKAVVTGCKYLTIRSAAGIKNNPINYIPSGGIVDVMGSCDPGGWVEISWGIYHGWVNAD